MGAGWPGKRLGAARTAGSASGVRGTNEWGCWVVPVGRAGQLGQRAPDAPAAHLMALGQRYGTRRLRAEVQADGYPGVGRWRIRRVLKVHGLRA